MNDGMTRVMLFGNLGAAPELRRTPSGASVLKLRLATNRSWVTKDGIREEDTQWHNVAVFGRRGEGLGRILRKGSFLLVEGRLHTHRYEKDGARRYYTEIVAENVVLGGRGGRHPDSEEPFEAEPEASSAADAWADANARPSQPDDDDLSARPSQPGDAGPSERPEPEPEPALPSDDAAGPDGGPSSEERRDPEVFDPAPLDPKPRRGGDGTGSAEVTLPPPRKRTRAPAGAPALAA